MGFSDIIAWANAGVRSLYDHLLRLILYVLHAVIVFARFLWRAIVQVFNFFLKGFQKQYSFDTLTWDGGTPSLFDRFRNIFDRIRQALHRWFDPLLRWLRYVREFWERTQRLQMLRLMQMLQRIRRALTVFRILGFKWAKRLDEKLYGLEAKLARMIIDTRRVLNDAINWITLITDPRLLIRTFPMLNSVWSSARQILGLLHLAQLGILGRDALDLQDRLAGWYGRGEIRQRARLRAAGVRDDYEEERRADLHAAYLESGS